MLFKFQFFVLTVLKTVLRNQKNLIFKNRLKHLKRKCFSVLRQKQSCSHGVKDGCKNLQRFIFKLLKPFFLSSEQGFTGLFNMLRCTKKKACLSYLFLLFQQFPNFKYVDRILESILLAKYQLSPKKGT